MMLLEKNMGKPWMMFTKEQAQELIDNTTYEWTTINGVNGRKFTSKTDSSKYIFLPAAGVWYGTNQVMLVLNVTLGQQEIVHLTL